MKGVLFILSILLTINSFSQYSFGVIGKINRTVTNYYLFNRYDKDCRLDYSTSLESRKERLFIIGDTLCKGTKNKCFLVVVDTSILWVEKVFVENYRGIENELTEIKKNIPGLRDRYLLAIKERSKIEIEDSLRAIEQIKTDKLIEDSLKKELDKSLTILRTKNIVLVDWSWNYPNEYSSFTEVKVQVINPFKQKIKYIWFSFKALNDVNDPVKDGISGATLKTVQGIGPIEYGGTGTYTFETVFYSKVIATLKMTQIKIQFFDGTTKLINNPIQLDSD